MGDEAAKAGGLEKLPAALKNRRKEITLSDGSKVTIEKWSWLKFQESFGKIGVMKHTLELCEASVVEADRSRVKDLDPEDLMLIAKEAEEMNMTEGLSKNMVARLRQASSLNEPFEKLGQ